MSGKKIVEVPLKIHIYKYILKRENWKGEILDVRKYFYPKKGNPDTNGEQKYFETLEKKIIVKVEISPSTRSHLYAMIQYFEESFKREMFAKLDASEGVFKPLREFYAEFEIYPSEYDFDTAWKRYQREKKRRAKRKIQNEQHQSTSGR